MSPNLIVFFENDTGEVFVFKNKTGAIKHARESGWIEKILQRDDMNVVIVATIAPIAAEKVLAMRESLSEDLESTVFKAKPDGSFEQLFSDAAITFTDSYFICKKQIARIDAVHQDPDDPRREIWSIDRPAIAALIKKLGTVNLNKHKKKNKRAPSTTQSDPIWKRVNETPNEYSMMQYLLNAIPGQKESLEARTRWIADFNALAQEIEEEIKHDQTGALDQISLPPWIAQLEQNVIWLYSPPLIKKGEGVTFEAVRLVVNADHPLKPNGIDVAARTVPLNENFNPAGITQYWCWLQNTNPDEIKEHPLVAIWFLWDSIARVGIEKGLETGLIAKSWVNNVFEHANTCQGRYPLAYYKRGRAANEYLQTLYRLCAARGITEDMLHGEGSRSGRYEGRYENSWINSQGVCKCCKFTKESPLSYGTDAYPYGSILGHVKSIRHRRNAAEYLLRKSQQQGLK